MSMGEKSATGKLVNKVELGALFGIARGTVDAMVRRGCPCSKIGKAYQFNTADVIAWELAQIASRTNDPARLRSDTAKLRIKGLEATRAERKLADLKARTVPVAEARKMIQAKHETIRKRMREVPAAVAARLPSDVAGRVEENLPKEIEQTLTILNVDAVIDAAVKHAKERYQ